MTHLAARMLLVSWIACQTLAFSQTPPQDEMPDAQDEYLLAIRYRGEQIGELVPTLLPPPPPRDGADRTAAVEGPALFLFAGVLAALGVRFERTAANGISGLLDVDTEPFEFEPSGAFKIGRLTGQLDAGNFYFRDNDLFLSATAIAQALPLVLVADTRSQTLRVRATAPMPIDLIRQREINRAKLISKDTSSPNAVADFPYRMLGRLNGDVRMNYNSTGGTGAQQVSYDGLISTELAYVATQLYFGGNTQQGVTELRLQVGRESTLGDVFGLHGVTSAYAGDVTAPFASLAGGGSLRGIAVSAYPIDRSDSFDSTTLQGDGLPGTDVELYRGTELLAFTQVKSDGRYMFANVPLLFGDNQLRIVFYGPSGKIREEARDFNVGSGMTPPGKVYWRLLAGDRGKRLLGGLLPSQGQAAPAQGANFSAEADAGITQSLSINTTAARAPEDSTLGSPLRDTLGFGLRVSSPLAYVSADVARQSRPSLPGSAGWAWRTAGLTGIGGITFSGRFAAYKSFLSEAASRSALALTNESQISARTTLPIQNFPVGVAVISERWKYANDSTEKSDRAQINFSVDRVFISQDIESRRLQYAGGSETKMVNWIPTASVNLGNDFRLSATARYDVLRSNLDQLLMSANLRLNTQSAIALGISRSNTYTSAQSTSRSYNAFASFSRDFGAFTGSISAMRQSDGSYFLGLGVNLGFSFDRDGRARFSSATVAHQGLADVFVFHDVNANNRFDQGIDFPVPGATVTVNGLSRPSTQSINSGAVVARNLSTTAPVTLDIDPASIDDPFLVSSHGGVRFLPRAGQSFETTIALVDTGSISGELRDGREGKPAVLAGVVIDLIRRDNNTAKPEQVAHVGFTFRASDVPQPMADGRQTVKTVRSQFDGNYLFDLVPPGDYIVQVRAGQSVSGARIAPLQRHVTLTLAQPNPEGIDLVLNSNTKGSGLSNDSID